MLAVSPLESRGDEAEFGGGEVMEAIAADGDQFLDFSDGNLLDCIDFDDLFAGMADDDDGDVLPDLEMVDLEMMAEFALSGEESSDANVHSAEEKINDGDSKESSSQTDSVEVAGSKEGRKSSAQSKKKNRQRKRKVKVDWTPELHRRFIQAVEQLGLDKAVPSKILEIMAVNGLTRHNIASHLQKYRSQRKHVLAREAEAASWSQRRQMYGRAVAGKRVLASPWVGGPPAIGFPPMAPPPPMHHQFCRPLHVWGHPSIDRQSMWPKHMAHSPPPLGPPLWPVAPQCSLPLPPPSPSSYWQQPHHHQVANSVTHGTPCYPPTPAMAVPRIPPPTVYSDELRNGLSTNGSGPPFDFHPSKESVDAAIGDALTKPWQPLPLGLRAPSLDSVLSELHRQGIPKIPSTSPT